MTQQWCARSGDRNSPSGSASDRSRAHLRRAAAASARAGLHGVSAVRGHASRTSASAVAAVTMRRVWAASCDCQSRSAGGFSNRCVPGSRLVGPYRRYRSAAAPSMAPTWLSAHSPRGRGRHGGRTTTRCALRCAAARSTPRCPVGRSRGCDSARRTQRRRATARGRRGVAPGHPFEILTRVAELPDTDATWNALRAVLRSYGATLG